LALDLAVWLSRKWFDAERVERRVAAASAEPRKGPSPSPYLAVNMAECAFLS
jgi:hypothetical protein